MTELETFRSEIRSWLEQETPKSLRGRPLMMNGRRGRASRDTRRPQALPRLHGRARVDGADVAGAIRRRRTLGAAGARPPRGTGQAQARAAAFRHGSLDDRADAARARDRGAEAASTCPRSSAASTAGVRAFPSPERAATWRRCALRPSSMRAASTTSSTGRRSWTSGGQYANWIFMLVRTDETTKHNGITFFADRHEDPGNRGQADPADQRQLPVLRDVFHGREGGRRERDRRGEQRLDGGQDAAQLRALRNGHGHVGTGRAARRCRGSEPPGQDRQGSGWRAGRQDRRRRCCAIR